MNTKKMWANLAVNGLTRTTKFYTEIGFKPKGASNELTIFTVGEDDFYINFFIKEKLETAIKGSLTDLQNGNEVVFTLAAESEEEVDNWEKEVTAAAGNIISQPETFGEGYYGFVFSDPDGHRFNVFYMEGMM